MDGIDFLIEFLNDYYKAKLKNIHDIAGNVHLSGYSELYKKDLFVKIFSNKDMFYAEQHVNQVYYPEIYLDSVIFEDNYVVVSSVIVLLSTIFSTSSISIFFSRFDTKNPPTYHHF